MADNREAARIMAAYGHTPVSLKEREIEGQLVVPIQCYRNTCRAVFTYDPHTQVVVDQKGIDSPCPYTGQLTRI